MLRGSIHLDLPEPTGSPSRPHRSVIGYRSVRRHTTAHVSTAPRPTTLVSQRVDAPASWGLGSAGRTSGPQLPPGPPTDTCRPIGGGDAFQERTLLRQGKGHVRSAHAGDSVSVASSALLRGGGREPQHTTI
jgi:hypothetical protein